jgi:asparagine synthase (glutamine-hydrolysing)
MCGYLIYKTDEKLPDEKVRQLTQALSHRGLETSVSNEKGAFVVHNVLPMTSLDKTKYEQPLRKSRWGNDFIGAFSGEVFNWKALKKKYDLPSENDSQLFTDLMMGPETNKRLHEIDGFWNFAAIDDGRLIGIVDYLGQKPLYYRTDMEAISSEPLALSLLGPVKRDHLFFSSIIRFDYDVTGRTAWKEIKQMPPGSYYSEGRTKNYWNWEDVEDIDLDEGISKSVKMRMGGEREVAILLSGGLDSSIIYEVATRTDLGIKAFHIENGEEDYVKLLTNNYEKIDLSNYSVSKEEAIRRNQTPVDLGSVVPQAQLANALKERGIHVVLSGDGADELFSGYNRSKFYDSQHSDVFNELPYYHNPRLDRIMMGSVVELRAPFLASYVVKHALGLDYDLRKNKKCLKTLFTESLPDEIINRDKLALKSEEVKGKSKRENAIENVKIFEKVFNL